LGAPRRFDKRAQAKEKDLWGTVRSASNFWREIPSAKLYLVASQMVNLNLTYESPRAVEAGVKRELSMRINRQQKFSVTVEFQGSATNLT
jgi:anti-sigma-K factor RskA